MKHGWKKWIKPLLAVVVGLALLDLFCFWYYNPADYVQDESRATDVVREAGRFTSRANEGFSWTTFDENGYNNPAAPGEDGVFVLMMGSSHIEGLYTLPGEDISSQLGEMLEANGLGGTVYNIGTSGHNLTRNVFNLDRALTRFAPSGYVTIETRTVEIYYQDLANALAGDMDRIAATQPVIAKWLSERPLLRTAARQILTLRSAEQGAAAVADLEEDAPAAGFELTQEVLDLYLDMMTQLFEMAREAADAHGATLIVYYHPTLLLQEDGSVVPDTDERVLSAFRAACDAAGVRFLDLTERFLSAYEREHILPHGFINTSPGVGHLNRDGNRLVAEALCEEILEQEAGR